MAASVHEYEKALKALEEVLLAYNNQTDLNLKKMLRDAIIQRFEFCIELAWKTAIKKLGLTITAPKPAAREMAMAGLIDDVQMWFDFIEARNKSSHTYDENVAVEVLTVTQKFLPHGEKLLSKLK